MSARERLGSSFVVVGATLWAYGATLAPSITWEHRGSDGGDLIAAAAIGRLSHPPGAPLYHWCARTLVRIVDVDPARVLNGLSAVSAAGATLLVWHCLRRRGVLPWIATASALTMAFAPWYWSQAVITEIYSMAALLSTAVLLLTASYAWKHAGLQWIAVGAALGGALSVHPATIFLLFYLVWQKGFRPLPFLSGLICGLVPYALLPITVRGPQPWGDLTTLSGWLTYVSGRIYWGYAGGLPGRYLPRRLLAWAVMLSRQFTPPGLLVVGVGGFRLWRSDRRQLLGLLLALGSVSLFAVGYNSADSWVYLVPFLPLGTVLLSEGMMWLKEQGMPSWAGLLIPLALLAVNWCAMDLHGDQVAQSWLWSTLDALPENAVLLSEEDRYTFALWYGVDARRWRPDVTVIDLRLWGYESYRAFLEATAGLHGTMIEALAGSRVLCKIVPSGDMVCQ